MLMSRRRFLNRAAVGSIALGSLPTILVRFPSRAMAAPGVLTEFDLPNPNSGPAGCRFGPDKNLWFSEQLGNRIGRITPKKGRTTEFPLPNANSSPRGLTAGPDGNLWFCEANGNRIAVITPDGDLI